VHRLISLRESDRAPRALCADAASLQNSVETQGFKIHLTSAEALHARRRAVAPGSLSTRKI